MTRFTIILVALLFVSAGGCQSGSTPNTPSDASAEAPHSATGLPSDIPKIEGGGVTVLPETVKGKWKAVRLVLEDKTTQATKEYVVPLNSRWNVPQTPLIVDVGDFLPDFLIQGSIFTSATTDPANPAVKVTISETGKPVFDAWLFALYPSVHPFTHPRYGLTLKEGIAAS